MRSPRYLIVGGDDRLVELAKIFRKNALDIGTFGMDKAEIQNVRNFASLEEALENSDVIICPVPFSKEVYKINSKYSSNDIEIEEFFKKLGKGKKLLLGAINNYSRELVVKY
jgi:dipicolinate synthase subunit A